MHARRRVDTFRYLHVPELRYNPRLRKQTRVGTLLHDAAVVPSFAEVANNSTSDRAVQL